MKNTVALTALLVVWPALAMAAEPEFWGEFRLNGTDGNGRLTQVTVEFVKTDGGSLTVRRQARLVKQVEGGWKPTDWVSEKVERKGRRLIVTFGGTAGVSLLTGIEATASGDKKVYQAVYTIGKTGKGVAERLWRVVTLKDGSTLMLIRGRARGGLVTDPEPPLSAGAFQRMVHGKLRMWHKDYLEKRYEQHLAYAHTEDLQDTLGILLEEDQKGPTVIQTDTLTMMEIEDAYLQVSPIKNKDGTVIPLEHVRALKISFWPGLADADREVELSKTIVYDTRNGHTIAQYEVKGW